MPVSTPPASRSYTLPALDGRATRSAPSKETRVMAWRPSDSDVSQQPLPARRPRKRRGLRRVLRIVLLLLLLGIVVRQANGAGGAFLADVLRSVIGPTATARVEATFLDLSDRLTSVKYQLGFDSVHSPWVVPTPGTVTVQPTALLGAAARQDAPPAPTIVASTRPVRHRAVPAPMPLRPLRTVVSPTLPGEGIWTFAGLPAPTHGSLPPVAKTFLRPDPARPYALSTILQVDLHVARLHLVAGISEPGGKLGNAGSGAIPSTDVKGARLLAVLNGGFKYSDGAYGLMSGGKVYVPPVWGAATIAMMRNGQVIMGSWGLDHRLTGANHQLVAWRQNANLLIDHGRITPRSQDVSAWGLSIMDSTYTWRSGIGLTAHGTLLYVAGNSLSAATLAQTLYAAGAVSAMQLDINPFWVRAFTYGRDGQGSLVAWALNPQMPGSGMEYLYGDVRDFFYLTRSRS